MIKIHSKFYFFLNLDVDLRHGDQKNLTGKTIEISKYDKQENTELISNLDFFEDIYR